MNDWVDSPVLVLRRWHGVERVCEVRTAICSLVYMNDEYQKELFESGEKRRGGEIPSVDSILSLTIL